MARRREEESDDELHMTALVVHTLFAELGGYCVLDVAGTRRCWAASASQWPVDLLGHLADVEQVERIAGEGALLPIVVDEPDDYRIAVFVDATAMPPFDVLHGDVGGWRFRAGPAGQQLLGIGYLQSWSPLAQHGVGFRLPEGEHGVRCRWGLRGGLRCIDLSFVHGGAFDPPAGRDFPLTLTFTA
jgi:hypothetical protein